MPTLRASFIFAAVLLPIGANAQSDPGLWRFVHPEAKALIGLDWARIRQSQAVTMIREKLLTAGALPIPDIPGMELLNDIDRILISSPGNKEAGNKSPDDTEQPPVLIAIHGHFDPAKLRQIFNHFGAKPQAYKSFQVYRPQGTESKDMAAVLFDAETLLFGDAPSIFATLDRNQFGPSKAEASSAVARAAQMEANYDFWVIMDATEIMSSDRVAALFRGGEWMSETRGFEAGVNLRTGLAADITVRFATDATAKRMTAELSRVMNLAAKDKGTNAQVQDLAKKLKFSLDGTATKISLRLTQQELEKSAQAFAASHKSSPQLSGNAGPKGTLTPALTPIPVAPKPAVIRIEGLDDGPREIPYPAQQH
jgi:hypothetical protein